MRKEYMKPEAELVKFMEEEEIMANELDMVGGTTDHYFSGTNPAAL